MGNGLSALRESDSLPPLDAETSCTVRSAKRLDLSQRADRNVYLLCPSAEPQKIPEDSWQDVATVAATRTRKPHTKENGKNLRIRKERKRRRSLELGDNITMLIYLISLLKMM
jgi:hypothetical protein